MNARWYGGRNRTFVSLVTATATMTGTMDADLAEGRYRATKRPAARPFPESAGLVSASGNGANSAWSRM